MAGVVVRDDRRILAIRRRDNGQWEPPGGVLELAEGIHEALIREVHEETGLRVEPGPLTGVYKNHLAGIVALVFRCKPVGGLEAQSPETADLRWITAQEVGELMDEAYAVRVLDALTDGPPAVRSHDGYRLWP